MLADAKKQIIEMIEKEGAMGATLLARRLSISPQAMHRHLKALCEQGALVKQGEAPRTRYVQGTPSPSSRSGLPPLTKLTEVLQSILGAHPGVRLVELFGSVARHEAGETSDVDILVWLGKDEPFSRQDIWHYWDRQTRGIPWATRASLIVRRLSQSLSIDTLLLDMPEEHVLVFDRAQYFPLLKSAVEAWRNRNGAVKVPSFGGTHFWKYSTRKQHLSEIDFSLGLKDVA